MSLHLKKPAVLAIVLGLSAAAYAGKLADRHKKWIEQDVHFLASKEEEQVFRDLKDDGERDRFIDIFWARRDPTPLTPVNEFRQDYEKRLAFVRGSGFPKTRSGDRSEMARIFLLLGQPAKQDHDGEDLTWSYDANAKLGLARPVAFRFSKVDGKFELNVESSGGLNVLAGAPAALILHPELHDLPTYPHLMDKAMAGMIDDLAKGGAVKQDIPMQVTFRYLKSVGGATYVCILADAAQKLSKPSAFGRCMQESTTQEFNEPMETVAAGDHTIGHTGFALMPGAWDVLLGVTEKGTGHTTLGKWHLDVPNYSTGKIEMTEIMGSDKIEPVSGESSGGGPTDPYLFGHYLLLPKLDSAYAKTSSLLAFFDVYNAGQTEAGTQLMVEYVLKKDGQYFNHIPPEMTQQKIGEAAAIALGQEISLETFQPGSYTLVVKIDDKVTGGHVERELPFEVK